MKTIAKNKSRYISAFVSMALLVMLLALSACSQEKNNEQEQAKDVAANVKLKTITIPVEGMTCAACVSRVKKSLRSLEGVTEVSVSLENRNTKVRYSSEKISPEQIAKAIDDLGYKAGTPKQE
jgi:mercuric ion binding protein